MAIEWTDTDPETGDRRYVSADKFARQWRFRVRYKRRTDWEPALLVSREMWETLFDAMERRYRRREGITDADLDSVRKILKEFREPPRLEPEAS